MLRIDLNCDMGEGYPNDAELMDYVTSVNIACGYHAGDAATMRKTAELAMAKDIAIGAHPGYRDAPDFGRKAMSLSSQDIFDLIVDQVVALKDICKAIGAKLHHVKPHGALYNQAARDQQLSSDIAKAVAEIDNGLILFGLSGSFMITEAEAAGLRTASEVFADRTYQDDGTLTPRSEPNALIDDSERALQQVLQMVRSRSVKAVSGKEVEIAAETICIHGDGPKAVEFARTVRRMLDEHSIVVRPAGY